MSLAVRVRFAPSPTGYLHVGGARTALFNWLLARNTGGVFVLRIEDTDRERSSGAMTDVILEGMRWVGLEWDEGPFHQADGIERHRADALKLLDSDAAYRCFCTVEDLDARRAAAQASGAAYRYDRRCASIPRAESDSRAGEGAPFTVRFNVPDGITGWEDAVHGRIEVQNREVEDFIVLRTDGTPIYNLAVVSDDIEMRITHVIRADEHINNTPRQILIYRALGAPLPVFAHVPMILGADGKKMSKRHGATAIGDYRLQGILPAAMRNFLALLGWAPGDDREIMPVEEMIERFSLEGVNKKSAVFDMNKLMWMNGQYISAMSAAELEPLVVEVLERNSASDLAADGARLRAAIDLVKTRAKSVTEFYSLVAPYVSDEVTHNPEAVAKHWSDATQVRARLEEVRERFAALPEWDAVSLEKELRGVAKRHGTAAAKVIHPLRVAVTGEAVSPGIFEVLSTLGRDVSLRRIERAVHVLRAREKQGSHSS